MSCRITVCHIFLTTKASSPIPRLLYLSTMFHFLLLLTTLFAVGQSCSLFMTKNDCDCYINMNNERSRFKRRLSSGRLKTVLIIPRGGGGGLDEVVSASSLPLVDTTTVALALRHTCETNRRLRTGMFISYKKREEAIVADTEQPFQETKEVRSSQHNIPPPPEVQSVSEEELTEERLKRELTVFHSLIPGGDFVDLHEYLETLLSAIGLGEKEMAAIANNPMEDEQQIILSLTLLYLDRSILLDNVDPQTGQEVWSPQSCPFLLPQTIHRLLLSALSLATKCIRGDKSVSNILREAANKAMHDEKSTISISDMEQIESWLIHSLGLQGTANNGIISHDEIGMFIRKWGATFYPQRLAKHDQSRMKRLEGFWKDRTAVFGGTNYQHGHGNHWSDSHQTKQQQQLEYNSNYYPSSDDVLNHPASQH